MILSPENVTDCSMNNEEILETNNEEPLDSSADPVDPETPNNYMDTSYGSQGPKIAIVRESSDYKRKISKIHNDLNPNFVSAGFTMQNKMIYQQS